MRVVPALLVLAALLAPPTSAKSGATLDSPGNVSWGSTVNVTLEVDGDCEIDVPGGLPSAQNYTVRVSDDYDGSFNITGPRQIDVPACPAPYNVAAVVVAHYRVHVPPVPARVTTNWVTLIHFEFSNFGPSFEVRLYFNQPLDTTRDHVDLAGASPAGRPPSAVAFGLAIGGASLVALAAVRTFRHRAR